MGAKPVLRDISTPLLERQALLAAYAELRELHGEDDPQKVMRGVLAAYAAVCSIARDADADLSRASPGPVSLHAYIDERHIVATAFWAVMEGVAPDELPPYAAIGARWSGFAAACTALNSFADFAVAIDGEQSGAKLARQVLECVAQGARDKSR